MTITDEQKRIALRFALNVGITLALGIGARVAIQGLFKFDRAVDDFVHSMSRR